MSSERTRRAALTAGLLALAGCPGSLDDPGSYALEAGAAASQSCGDIPRTVFAASCTLSGCHGASAPAASLDLASPDVYARLAGKAASGGPGMLVDPGGNPMSSVLYLKLTSTPPFGAQMPLTGSKLDPGSLACVASWIASRGGAGDAGTPSPDASPPADGGDEASPADAGGPDTGAGPETGTQPDGGAPVEDAGHDGSSGGKDAADG